MNRVLWTVQGLLSLVFLFGGAAKLSMPLDELEAVAGMPGAFLVFISVCEILGALGLIVPAITRIRPGLTPLAAAGLTIIMIGATVLTAAGVGGGDVVMALFPLAIGLLVAFVAYGRTRLVPLRGRVERAALQAAG
jgi:hypothetical protein